MRRTRQRRVILDVLHDASDHPAADEIYRRVRRRLPRISLGTVYRNLEVLAEQGAIRRVPVAGQATRFDGETGPHHHVRCVRCGRLADVPAETCTVSAARVRTASGFRVLDCRLEVTGLCPACQAAEAEADEPQPPRAGRAGPKTKREGRRKPGKTEHRRK